MATFGLQLPNFTFGLPDVQIFDEVSARAVAAEEAGFSSVWVMDHFYQLPPLGGSSQPMLEAYTLLGALATVTRSVDLGTLVTGVTYRNPAMLAKIVTTLDVISKGRAILGIGAAWHDVEHEGLGFDFPSAGERLDRLEDAVQICRAMFREEAPSFSGEHHRIKEARNVPRPVRPGGPPIMIGGGGEKRTLRLVAQHADLCNVTGDLDNVKHKIEVLKGHCSDVGRDFSEITVSRLNSVFLTGSDEETKQIEEFIAAATGGELGASGFHIGQPDEVAGQIKAAIDAGVEYHIFNLPTGDVATIGQLGDLVRGL